MIETYVITTIILTCCICIPLAVFYIYCFYRLFEKLGFEGWRGIIPFYNVYLLVNKANLNWWYFVIYAVCFAIQLTLTNEAGFSFLLGLANFVVMSLIFYNLCKKFKQTDVITVLTVIFPCFMVPYLALSKSCVYDDTIKVTPNAYIDYIQTSTNHTEEKKEEKKEKVNFCPECGEKLIIKCKFCPKCGHKL